MDDRTREYLRGRFGDFYRRTDVTPPPAPNEREWGYIPWRAGGTTMVRHESWLDITGGSNLGDFLAREAPRHVYFSAGRYDTPGAGTMTQKGWRASDLIFDLDADHLPGVDPGETPYAEMLATCKEALLRLVNLLEDDFGFEDLTIVFSGGRGYHVHVRDDGVLELGREERREIVEYVCGPDVEFAELVDTEAVAGMGLKNPAQKRSLPTDGGWGARVHDRLMNLVGELERVDDETAVARLREFEGVGEGKATAALRVVRENADQLRAGNIDVHPAFVSIARLLFERTLRQEGAPIDEPVTTDINRLIRLPGTLHGGSGLRVMRIPPADLAGFNPLDDAIPDPFRDHEIAIEVTDSGPVEFDGDSFTISEGEHHVSEAVGVFLMTRGRARKVVE